MGGLGDFLFGEKGKIKQLPTKSPQQMQNINQILSAFGGQESGMGQGMGQGGQGGMGGILAQLLQALQSNLEPGSEADQRFAAPYLREFNEKTIPGIAERFAGGGALSSSGFGQALSSAGAGLQENLASMRGQQQNQSIGSLLQLLQSALGQQTFDYHEKPASSGFLPTLAGTGLKAFFGGGA